MSCPSKPLAANLDTSVDAFSGKLMVHGALARLAMVTILG